MRVYMYSFVYQCVYLLHSMCFCIYVSTVRWACVCTYTCVCAFLYVYIKIDMCEYFCVCVCPYLCWWICVINPFIIIQKKKTIKNDWTDVEKGRWKNECENYLFKCSFLLTQNEDGTNEESQDNRNSRDHPPKALSPTLIIANDGCIVYEYHHKVSKQALKTGQKTSQLNFFCSI